MVAPAPAATSAGESASGGTGTGGGGYSGSGGNWLSTGGTGTGGDPGSGGTGSGGDAGSGGTGGTGSGGDVGSGGTGTGGDAGSGGTGTGGDAGSGGIGGTGTGGDSGGGGTGGTDCPELPSCNWCGGDDLMDANGCVTGWICANGIDPCEDSSAYCADTSECEADEVCEDNLCWSDTSLPSESVPTFEWVANPCTTDPCLPGMVAAIVADPPNNTAYVIVDGGGWVWSDGSWDGFDGFVPLDGQSVMASGRVSYHTDINGQVYLEIELTNLTPRVGPLE